MLSSEYKNVVHNNTICYQSLSVLLFLYYKDNALYPLHEGKVVDIPFRILKLSCNLGKLYLMCTHI